LPTRLGLPPARVVYKQEVSSLPEVMGANPGDLESLGEASLDLQQALIAE
jgi:hypothetical protein